MDSRDVIHVSAENYPGLKIDVLQYQPTKRPIEDRFSISTKSSNRLILGVYDGIHLTDPFYPFEARSPIVPGHGGSDTAEHISNVLPAALLSQPPEQHVQVFRETDRAIIRAFTKDHSLRPKSKSKDWVHHAQVVRAGCTALVLDVDLKTLIVSYANAGDCRAVVYTPGDGEDRLQQTEDLNAKTPSEQQRLSQEHAGEDFVVVSGRLFGRLMSTRGFGDACYKLPHGILGSWQHRRYIDALSAVEESGKIPMNAQYHSMFHLYRTPPYLTATPEVGTMHLQKNSFAIIATDGLWDCISSSEAVKIIRAGLEQEVDNLAEYLLRSVAATKVPGDDVTILLLRILPDSPSPSPSSNSFQSRVASA